METGGIHDKQPEVIPKIASWRVGLPFIMFPIHRDGKLMPEKWGLEPWPIDYEQGVTLEEVDSPLKIAYCGNIEVAG